MTGRTTRAVAVVGLLSLALGGCGFISHDDTLSERYVTELVPDDPTGLLLTWPIHLVGLAGTATVDQGVHTVTCAPLAVRDAWDWFLLRGDGNNVLFERAVALPKTLATPLVLVGSYLTRWFAPIDAEDRPFGDPPGPPSEDELDAPVAVGDSG